MTYSIINQLNLKELSAVFCSKKSVDKLKSEYKFKQTFENWSYDQMQQYNFFTSRFQVALDMIMEEKPHVILLTEVYFAEYTMFDPYTDVIQAVGRFRNGVTSISHIANTNTHLPTRTLKETKEYIHSVKPFMIHYIRSMTKQLHQQQSRRFMLHGKASLLIIG